VVRAPGAHANTAGGVPTGRAAGGPPGDPTPAAGGTAADPGPLTPLAPVEQPVPATPPAPAWPATGAGSTTPGSAHGSDGGGPLLAAVVDPASTAALAPAGLRAAVDRAARVLTGIDRPGARPD